MSDTSRPAAGAGCWRSQGRCSPEDVMARWIVVGLIAILMLLEMLLSV